MARAAGVQAEITNIMMIMIIANIVDRAIMAHAAGVQVDIIGMDLAKNAGIVGRAIMARVAGVQVENTNIDRSQWRGRRREADASCFPA